MSADSCCDDNEDDDNDNIGKQLYVHMYIDSSTYIHIVHYTYYYRYVVLMHFLNSSDYRCRSIEVIIFTTTSAISSLG